MQITKFVDNCEFVIAALDAGFKTVAVDVAEAVLNAIERLAPVFMIAGLNIPDSTAYGNPPIAAAEALTVIG